MPIISADICAAPIEEPNGSSWMEDRLDRSQNLKRFTIFNKLFPELRLKIWCHCMPPPGRAVFDHSLGPRVLWDPSMGYYALFHPEEDVLTLPDNFFGGRTPVLFQVCQESRYIGKRRIFPVTGLRLFHGGNIRYQPTFQMSIMAHPFNFFIKTLWFSPKDTIVIPIRSADALLDIQLAAVQIARTWDEEENPLMVRKVQFSLLITDINKLNSKVAGHLTKICSLVRDLGRSATIFIGMGAGFAHRRGRFYLNDDQEEWVYNEDGTFCNPDLQKQLEHKLAASPGKWVLSKDYDPSNVSALSDELGGLDSIAASSPDKSFLGIGRINLPCLSRCAVISHHSAYKYCLNSEIIEAHFAKVNPLIRYVDQIRDGLVEDRYTGGWERGEAWRRGLSFKKTGLYGEDSENDVWGGLLDGTDLWNAGI
ncbi:hypothetical protein VC83_01405 [Pseudogymnoascus destructans]|uniref:2EXR domain-containing protein n=2 Tax=Pseudogymnoascus destructans TaxID=655981 RepID=L8FN31_PSED2|nr:uncharacterized protein VC83_01405 [Pseudogymnoascus destructans]ELR02327.1 hypothetical protein GMDG_05394 [Pseudogymnoascus destructans 20631-21]OAF61885.1 hypothetical protein VC83_01405 [Pseudogymnoascus destructans]